MTAIGVRQRIHGIMREIMDRRALNRAWLRRPRHPSLEAASRQAAVFNTVIALLALFIFGATFRAGIDRGMDQLVSMEGYGRVLNAIATVMTEQWLGITGYALNNCIRNKLEQRGFTRDPDIVKRLGMSVPQNLRAPFLDKLLVDMQGDLLSLPDYCRSDNRGLGADDLGYVDFARMAFSLFGQHIRAFYYLFFLIYGLTILLALLERQRDRMGQVIIVGVAGLIYVSCYYSDFLLLPEPVGSGNMLNPRFMPVLALIPGTHLLLMWADEAPLRWWKVPIVIFQSAIILFAIHIRASAIWWVLPLVLAAVAGFLLFVRTGRRNGASWIGAACRGLVSQWQVLIAIAVVLIGVRAVAWSLHPVYSKEGWLQHHALWHSIYYSFQFHPKYIEKYDAYHNGQGGDQMPIAAAMAYLKEHPEEDTPDIYLTGNVLKYSAMECLVRLAFFEFVRRDPWFAFETFFVIKPQYIVEPTVRETKLEWDRASWKAHALYILIIGLIGGLSARRWQDMQRLSRVTAVFALGALGSLSIPWLTVPQDSVMSEEIMPIQVAGSLLLGLALGYCARARPWHYTRAAIFAGCCGAMRRHGRG
jgi:hypothetical protein